MVEWHVRLGNRILQRFWMDEGSRLTIGRVKAAEVSLDNTAVSREHAMLEMQQGTFYVTDLDSTNGTRVNGKKITGRVQVHAVDQINIGKFCMVPVAGKENRDTPVTPADFEGTVFVTPETEKRMKRKQTLPVLAVVKGRAMPAQFKIGARKTVTLGRGSEVDVHIPSWWVAAIQCRISARNDAYYLSHQGGWKSTKLNGRKMRGEQQLHRGDIIEMGGTRMRFG